MTVIPASPLRRPQALDTLTIVDRRTFDEDFVCLLNNFGLSEDGVQHGHSGGEAGQDALEIATGLSARLHVNMLENLCRASI